MTILVKLSDGSTDKEAAKIVADALATDDRIFLVTEHRDKVLVCA